MIIYDFLFKEGFEYNIKNICGVFGSTFKEIGMLANCEIISAYSASIEDKSMMALDIEDKLVPEFVKNLIARTDNSDWKMFLRIGFTQEPDELGRYLQDIEDVVTSLMLFYRDNYSMDHVAYFFYPEPLANFGDQYPVHFVTYEQGSPDFEAPFPISSIKPIVKKITLDATFQSSLSCIDAPNH